jgi:DNA-binding transcriptional MocR family regulator
MKVLSGQKPQLQVLFLWICNHADEKGVCFPDIDTLAEETGMSRDTVIRYTKRLVELGILLKKHKFKNNKQISNEYQIALRKSGVAEINPKSRSSTKRLVGVAEKDPGGSREQPTGVAESDTELNPEITKPRELNISAGAQVNVLIQSFAEVNPTYDELFKNNTQRKALEYLVNKFGFEKTKATIESLEVTNAKRYAPTITTRS